MGKNNIIKDALSLFIITAIAGLFLSFIYQVTKEPIALKAEERQKEAYMAVCQSASNFSEIEINANAWQEIQAKYKLEKVILNSALEAVSADNELLGYVFTVRSKEGYSGNIDITVGISLDGTMNGIQITSISETAGLGAKANTEEYKNQYANKKVNLFRYVKTGKREDFDIDAISGATITTNAVTNAVNGALKYFTDYLAKEGN